MGRRVRRPRRTYCGAALSSCRAPHAAAAEDLSAFLPATCSISCRNLASTGSNQVLSYWTLEASHAGASLVSASAEQHLYGLSEVVDRPLVTAREESAARSLGGGRLPLPQRACLRANTADAHHRGARRRAGSAVGSAQVGGKVARLSAGLGLSSWSGARLNLCGLPYLCHMFDKRMLKPLLFLSSVCLLHEPGTGQLGST